MPTCPKCNHTWKQIRKKKEYKIIFNYDTARFEGLNGEIEIWQEKFPAINVAAEIKKAEGWCYGNPDNKKTDWKRFLTTWLIRAQNSAPGRGNGQNANSGRGSGGPRTFTKQREIEQREQFERLLGRGRHSPNNSQLTGRERSSIDGNGRTILEGEVVKVSKVETKPPTD